MVYAQSQIALSPKCNVREDMELVEFCSMNESRTSLLQGVTLHKPNGGSNELLQ